ncbi:MAG: pyridoxal phosphate-dependent aminotransferase [Candidatus Omnitrophota bacterium]|nr:pyridoxal phosphate-dependent aminotransferase [Candidatus Omnitrophota bacterium]
MKFSKRTDWESAPNALSACLARLKQAGEPVIDLTESNPTRCGFKFLNAAWLKPLSDEANLRYEPHPKGLLEARESVCAYYRELGYAVNPEQVFLTASTSEAYSYLFRLLTDPGDRVMAPQPSYPLFDYLAQLGDVQMERYRLRYDAAWKLDKASLTGQTAKAVLTVNPNNPTGTVIGPGERTALNNFAGEANAAIISDEVFLDYVRDEDLRRSASFAANDTVLTFTLSGVSKLMALPQMKLSWIVVSGPPDERDEAVRRLEIIADAYLSANTPSQRALATWMQMRPEATAEIRGRLKENGDCLAAWVRESGRLELLSSDGGWYAVLKAKTEISDEDLAVNLLERRHVYVYPGYLFDFEEGTYLVISLLPESAIFQEGLERLKRDNFFFGDLENTAECGDRGSGLIG